MEQGKRKREKKRRNIGSNKSDIHNLNNQNLNKTVDINQYKKKNKKPRFSNNFQWRNPFEVSTVLVGQ